MRNERVRELTRQDQLLTKIREHLLRWWSHVQQMEDGRGAKQALNWIPEGSCKIGRPCITYINCCSRSAAYSTSPQSPAGHILDLVITRNNTEISDLLVGAMLSDHAVIRFTLCLKKSCTTSTQAVTSRAWRRLSLEAFASDLTVSPLCSDLAALDDLSIDDLVNQYRVVMMELLD